MGYSEIWAPWRLAYVQSEHKDELPRPASERFLPGADESCFICQAVADDPANDAKRYVVWRGEKILVIMNRFPYNNGHLLVTPKRHVGKLTDLTEDEHLELMKTLSRLTEVMDRILNAQGYNIGLNLGRVAGAGLPGHLHWHIVPRWNGDTNFMPVFGCVNVISQSLEALWEELVKEMNG